MAMPQVGPDAAATERAEPQDDGYTGVVLIHGIGNQKRNDTLLEALDALSYWFNHHAGLDLQPEGAGRMWLTTDLRDDDDPDAPASRATMELVPPASGDAEDTPLRLEFREVWWAESFGLPSVGATIRWGRVQLREQLINLLLPAGIRLGPAAAAHRAPAREIAQAITYEPTETDDHKASGQAAGRQGPTWEAAALWAYDLVQYIWKLAQWLALAVLIGPLVLLLGLLRLLAAIPFLQSSLITGATAIINYVMLHWISSMQVYLLEYGRSSAIRQRFDREVEALLNDPQCERIVVIAHSMGTVISYEGLTTLLARPEWHDAVARRPITYVCLAQALRRIWLLSRTDPERLRGVLPEKVRWLHFWARYDPVAVGPLDPHTLPPPVPRAPAQVRAADLTLRARLGQCENVDVVNTDSVLFDHSTYWQNVEQVVGPIARELVAGHPALEQLAQAHLATRAEVQRRRWGVAWRALVSLAGGFGAAALLVALDATHNGGLGRAIASGVGALLSLQPVQQFLASSTFGLSTLIGNYLTSCTHGACGGLQDLAHNPNLIVPYLLTYYLRPENLVTGAAALVLFAVGIQLTSMAVAAPSPFSFRNVAAGASATLSVFGVAAVSLLSAVAGLLVFLAFLRGANVSIGDPRQLPAAAAAYFWAIGLAELGWFVALVTALLDCLLNRHWAWVAGLTAGALLALVAPPVYSIAVASLALIGCVPLAIAAVHSHRRGVAVSLVVVAVPLAAAVGDLLRPHTTLTFGLLAVLAPPLIYGIWAGPAQLRLSAEQSALVRGALVLSVAYLLVLLGVVAGLVSTAPSAWVPAIVVTTFLGVAAWGLCLADAARAERWGWVALMIVLTVPLIILSHAQVASRPLIQLPSQISFPLDPWLVWPVPFVVAALSYALWAGPAPSAPADKPAWRVFSSLPARLAPVAAAATIVVLVAALLALDIAPTIPIAQFPLPNAITEPIPIAPGLFFPFASAVVPLSNGSQPHEIVVGPDGNLWFTEFGGGQIGRLTTSGQLTEFRLPRAGSAPTGITAGPDGAVWFTDVQLDQKTFQVVGSEIGRITSTGTIQEFALPRADGAPNEIAAGPDGALWFTAEANIERITPDGQVSVFALPTPDSIALGMAAGPDGNLWFAELRHDATTGQVVGGQIGRITPDGAIQEFPLPDGSQPNEMAAGPDGNLWFTDDGSGQIGRITPAGSIQEFAVPLAGAVPFGITAGPDGNLWFAEIQFASTQVIGSQIGRITPAGAIRMYSLPIALSEPFGITAGPDGSLWFAESKTDRIGRASTWLTDLGAGAG
jgi:streptogramin lyase